MKLIYYNLNYTNMTMIMTDQNKNVLQNKSQKKSGIKKKSSQKKKINIKGKKTDN